MGHQGTDTWETGAWRLFACRSQGSCWDEMHCGSAGWLSWWSGSHCLIHSRVAPRSPLIREAGPAHSELGWRGILPTNSPHVRPPTLSFCTVVREALLWLIFISSLLPVRLVYFCSHLPLLRLLGVDEQSVLRYVYLFIYLLPGSLKWWQYTL